MLKQHTDRKRLGQKFGTTDLISLPWIIFNRRITRNEQHSQFRIIGASLQRKVCPESPLQHDIADQQIYPVGNEPLPCAIDIGAGPNSMSL